MQGFQGKMTTASRTADSWRKEEAMEKLTSHRNLKELVERHGFQFTKSLGQNFLVDENILRKIVEAAELTKEDLVIEVGPGAGTLTRALSEAAGRVIAIEIDRKLIPILEETLADRENVQILNQDILKADLKELAALWGKGRKIKVVANLPYYITTPIILRFLEERIPMHSMTVMMQKEVADRIHAQPGTKDYGSLTIALRYYCESEVVAKAPRGAFVPMPAVDSCVLHLRIKDSPGIVCHNEALFFEVVRAGFSKRRKTLQNALSSYGSLGGKKEAEEALQRSGIDGGRRAETLTMDEFAALANAYDRVLGNKDKALPMEVNSQ